MVDLRDLRIFLLAAAIAAPLLMSTDRSVLVFGVVVLYALAAALVGISVLHVLRVGKVRTTRAFRWSAFWFALLIVWSLLRVEDSAGLERTFQWIGLLVLFSALAVYPLSHRELESLTWVSGVATVLTVALSIFGGGAGVGRVAWFHHPNFVGSLLLIYAFFLLLGLSSSRKSTKIYAGIALAVLVAGLVWTESRASMLAMLILVVFLTAGRVFLEKGKKRILIWSAYGVVILLGLTWLLLPLMFGVQQLPQLPGLDWATLNSYSLQIWDKRADAGRLEMWSSLLQYIGQRPVVGWGAGVTPETLTGVPLSAHNGYLQVWLQFGAVGLVLQVALLASMLFFLYKRRNRVARVALAVFSALIIHELFEVTLFQNDPGLPLLIWLVAGIGVGTRGTAPRRLRAAPVRPGRRGLAKAPAR